MITELYEFQKIGVDFLASRKTAILADGMGLGKTVMAIEAIKKRDLKNGIIITPQSIRHTWFKVFKDQFPGMAVKEIFNTRVLPEPDAFNIVNYDIVWRQPLLTELKSCKWDLLIADESHYLKNIASKRGKTVLGKKGLYSLAEYVWLMTGTPVLNKPMELYAPLRALVPLMLGKYKGYMEFAYRYCGAFQDTFGFNVEGASNLGELASLLAPVMLRRTKEEVLPELPEAIYEKIYLDPSEKLMETTNEEIVSPKTASIKRALGLLKVEPAIAHIESVLKTKDKVVVFTWHKIVAEKLKKHFENRAVLYTGEQTSKLKEAAKASFIKDKNVQVFIGQLEASGVGVDGLQSVCDTAIFVELTGVPGKIKQAVDRLRRIGQDSTVWAQFLVVEDSTDEKIVDKLIEKSKNINKIMKEEGKGVFVRTKCTVCNKKKELHELKRVAGLSVCKDCGKTLSCFG